MKYTATEGNKLIALFMGAVDETGYFQASTIGRTKVPTGRMFMKDRFPSNMHLCKEDYLQYHTSWDWLMPVVEKIESMQTEFDGYFGFHISSNGCTVQGTRLNTSIENPHYAYFNDVTHDTKLLATWTCVVQFIQWYNSQKSTK